MQTTTFFNFGTQEQGRVVTHVGNYDIVRARNPYGSHSIIAVDESNTAIRHGWRAVLGLIERTCEDTRKNRKALRKIIPFCIEKELSPAQKRAADVRELGVARSRAKIGIECGHREYEIKKALEDGLFTMAEVEAIIKAYDEREHKYIKIERPSVDTDLSEEGL